jgi:hypothetical protein
MTECIARQVEPDSDRNGRIGGWQAVLTVVGLVLIAWGAAPCLMFSLIATFLGLSWPMEKVGLVGLVFGLGLLWLVPSRLLHLIPRIVTRCLAAAWLLSCVPHFFRIFARWLWEFDDQAMLALMVVAIGLILIWSNDGYRPIVRSSSKCAAGIVSWARNRAKSLSTAAILILWLLNPDNAHTTCIQASQASEKAGGYRTAIIFATLARDVFPERIWCANCFESVQQELTWRIICLQHRAGGDVPWKDVAHTGGANEKNTAKDACVNARAADNFGDPSSTMNHNLVVLRGCRISTRNHRCVCELRIRTVQRRSCEQDVARKVAFGREGSAGRARLTLDNHLFATESRHAAADSRRPGLSSGGRPARSRPAALG